MYRFYVPTLTTADSEGLELSEDQSHHARAVLRLAAKEPVVVFDGKGHWARGIVSGVSRKAVAVQLTGAITTDLPASPALTIAVAVPKADRADWLIEQASQLNVARIQWLATERTVVKPKEAKLEKHRRLAIESAKQCQRTHVLQVLPPVTLVTLLVSRDEGVQLDGPYSQTLWLDPAAESQPIQAILQAHDGGAFERILALVGPEGGWSPAEESLLQKLADQKKLTRVRLTSTILRIETAAAAIAAIVMSA